ncbi:MAG: sensor histidine kinase, partial [Verrucomicrobiota bacterium]
MSGSPTIRNPWLRWGLFLGFWTLLGLSFAGQLYLTQSKVGNPVSWRFAATSSLAAWYIFALLSLPTWWLGRRFPIEGNGWRRHLGVHLIASAGFSFLWMVLRAAVEQFQSNPTARPVSFVEAFQHALVATFFFNLLIYWAIVSVSHAFEYYRKLQERELRASELEIRLAQARLQALQMQLNPHFLFNTLHAIAALMRKDIESADRMIARLSELLRYALESTEAHEVSLRQELDFLERYLEIEKTRFGSRLTFQSEVDPQTLPARVPNLVLQPLIENAIRHGIEPQSKPGRIELRIHKKNEWLLLEVRDNGRGLLSGKSPEEGVGLSNTRARLEQLY